MAIRVRGLTTATTVAEVENGYPGGVAAFLAAHPAARRVHNLLRLPAPVPGLRCGQWSAPPGNAYAAEWQPHPDIQMLGGRRRKLGVLVLRGTPLRVVRAPAPPATGDPAPMGRDIAECIARPRTPRAPKPLLHPYARQPYQVGGDSDRARALRIALWLSVELDIPADEQRAEHLALLPPEQFDVTATAIAWEVRWRTRAHASGLANSAFGAMLGQLREIEQALAASGMAEVFGAHRWPAEREDRPEVRP